MDQEVANERLSRISTMWSLVRQAHTGLDDAATAAQHALMQRYCGAVYRYLLGALRDEDAAWELFQEFALRFIRGDFRRADPRRGRFRDYVKTSIIHLIQDYRKSKRLRPEPLRHDLPSPPAPDFGTADADAEFAASWRDELLHRTWEALRQAQPTFHAVLLKQAEEPEVPAAKKANEVARQLGEPFSGNRYRVTLHRARQKFGDLLLEEVENSLDSPTPDVLLHELKDLRLLKLVASALARRDIGCTSSREAGRNLPP